jgi:hypothetical protein
MDFCCLCTWPCCLIGPYTEAVEMQLSTCLHEQNLLFFDFLWRPVSVVGYSADKKNPWRKSTGSLQSACNLTLATESSSEIKSIEVLMSVPLSRRETWPSHGSSSERIQNEVLYLQSGCLSSTFKIATVSNHFFEGVIPESTYSTMNPGVPYGENAAHLFYASDLIL